MAEQGVELSENRDISPEVPDLDISQEDSDHLSDGGEDEIDLMNDDGELEVGDEEGLDDVGEAENADPSVSNVEEPVRKARAPTCPLDVPFSVVRRIMKAAAPNKRFSPELIAAFARGAGTFGLYLLSACQEGALEGGRSTIRPLEVVQGLIACGFPELAEEARVTLHVSDSKKKKNKKKTRKPN